MNYEQLLEMQENAGHVNRGYSIVEISFIPELLWRRGSTNEAACHICMEDFKQGSRFKALKCGHSYCSQCIDEWLKREKRCPVCNAVPI